MFRLIILRFLESYFRRRWLYLLPTLLMTLAGGIYLYQLEPVYVAKGVFSVQAESLVAKLTSIKGAEFTWQTPSTATVKEFYELNQTDSFVRAIIQKTDLEAKMAGGKEEVEQTLKDVREAVWAISQGDNQVVIAAKHEQPQVAYQLVNAVIDTFVQWKINADLTDSQAAAKFFSDLSVKYKVEVDSARNELYDYLNSHPQPIKGERPGIEQLEIARLQSQLDMAISRYAKALDNVENSQLASAQAESSTRQSYIVIDSPLTPTKPETSRKQLALELSIFVIVGVILSGLGVTGAALLDRTFRFPLDIWHGLTLPVLTQVPDMTPAPVKQARWKLRKKAGDDAPLTDEEPAPVLAGGPAQAAALLEDEPVVEPAPAHPGGRPARRSKKRAKNRSPLSQKPEPGVNGAEVEGLALALDLASDQHSDTHQVAG